MLIKLTPFYSNMNSSSVIKQYNLPSLIEKSLIQYAWDVQITTYSIDVIF